MRGGTVEEGAAEGVSCCHCWGIDIGLGVRMVV